MLRPHWGRGGALCNWRCVGPYVVAAAYAGAECTGHLRCAERASCIDHVYMGEEMGGKALPGQAPYHHCYHHCYHSTRDQYR